MGLPTRLECRQELQCGQQQSSYLLVCGAGARDVRAVTVFKSRPHIYPSLSVLWSSHARCRVNRIGCSSHPSAWKRSSCSSNASVDSREAQSVEQLWQAYFADPTQWWDNRIDKSNPRSPDFKHKVTRKALWIDGWSTPLWVKAMLKLVTEDKLRSHADYGTRDSQETAQAKRLPTRNNGKRSTVPTSAREPRHIVQGGGGGMNMQSARTTIEAASIMKNCVAQGISIDSGKYVDVLKRCLKEKHLVAAKQVHDCIIKSGMEQYTYVVNHLLRVYIRCGRLQDARQLFDNLVKKDVFSWNIMIGAYAERNDGKDAMDVLDQMRREGAQPNKFTYCSILKACASPSALERGEETHAVIRHAGFETDVHVGTALVQMYAKCGSLKEARQAFEKVRNHNVISWTVLIGAYAESGHGVEAYELFLQMQKQGCVPNAITFISILNPSASTGALDWVKDVHRHALKAGLDSDVRVGTALVHMYAKSGGIDDARRVFDNMDERNVITWTVMIGGLAEHGCGREALEVFEKMNVVGVKPDEQLIAAVLLACCHAGFVDEGRQVFLAMSRDYGMEPNVVHYTCMVDLFGRAGLLEEAKVLIGNMPVEPNAATWGALLGACRTYGNLRLGELAAKELVKLDSSDASAYVLLSNIYAAAGSWEAVVQLRAMMQERGIRKEPGCSWIEVDNKIHDFVVEDTSHPEAKEIYAELSRLSEKMKAEGYIPDTRLVLRNFDEKEKELALCSHSEKLAIAYGLLRTPYGEPIRVYKNLRVCSDCHTATKFIAKVTGREIVARDANRFHHFKDGVCSCGDYW